MQSLASVSLIGIVLLGASQTLSEDPTQGAFLQLDDQQISELESQLESLLTDQEREELDSGYPFGEITDRDVKRLAAFAEKRGMDLQGDFQKVYDGNDSEALARVFDFSLQFASLDRNAATYGHVVYCALLNLGERNNCPFFDVLRGRSPQVRQRIMDFIFYQYGRLSKQKRTLATAYMQACMPSLFPSDYQFGRENPLFPLGSDGDLPAAEVQN